MSKLRAVVVSRKGAFNNHVLGRIAAECDIVQVLRPASASTMATLTPQLKEAPVRTATKIARLVIFRAMGQRLDGEIASKLPAQAPLPRPERVITGAELNGEGGQQLLRSVAPDIMVLSGAPLLKPAVFNVPRHGTVNVHWGISPAYRGEQSIFYATYRGDYEAIGVTLHYVDRGIDTGAVLAHGRPAMAPGDDFATIYARCARLAGDMIADFLSALAEGPVSGEVQRGDGQLIRSADRRIWHHVHHNVRERRGRRLPERQESIRYYYR